jgi:hypothetical protein
MSNPELRRRLGAAGAARVQHHMNFRTMAARLTEVYQEVIAEQASICAARRQLLWPLPLRLDPQAGDVVINGTWHWREAIPDHLFLVGTAGDTLTFLAPSEAQIEITYLRHAWSGLLEIQVDAQHTAYIDAYAEAGLDLTARFLMILPKQTEPMCIAFRISPERNPSSSASQFWLRQITVWHHNAENQKVT